MKIIVNPEVIETRDLRDIIGGVKVSAVKTEMKRTRIISGKTSGRPITTVDTSVDK